MTVAVPPVLRTNVVGLDPQARLFRTEYGAAVPKTLFQALAESCTKAREDAGLNQAYIAAFAGRDQSTIDRFEKKAQTGNLERLLLAYAMATGVPPSELLKRAEALWEPDLNPEQTSAALLAAIPPREQARLGISGRRAAKRSA